MSSVPANNALIVIEISLVVGAFFGLISGKLGAALKSE